MRKFASAIIGSVAVVAVACGGGDEVDSQATINAAVQGTISNQPTATPDVQATVDAAVAATAAAQAPTATPPPTAGPTSTPTVEPIQTRFDETALNSLLDENDISANLGGEGIESSGFIDFSELSGTQMDPDRISFTGLVFQGPDFAVNFQIIDFVDNQSANDGFEDPGEGIESEATTTRIGDESMRVSSAEFIGISFIKGNVSVAIFITGWFVGQDSWDALESLASLVDSRL